jgi:hypothetical protein
VARKHPLADWVDSVMLALMRWSEQRRAPLGADVLSIADARRAAQLNWPSTSDTSDTSSCRDGNERIAVEPKRSRGRER